MANLRTKASSTRSKTSGTGNSSDPTGAGTDTGSVAGAAPGGDPERTDPGANTFSQSAGAPTIGIEEVEPAPEEKGPNILQSLFGAFGSMASATPTNKSKSAKAKAAQDDAEYYLTIANLMVTGMLQSPEASVNDTERGMIVPGLADMLQKSEGLARLGQYMNPLALIMGIGLWGSRCFVVWKEKHPGKAKDAHTEIVHDAPIQYTPPPMEPYNNGTEVGVGSGDLDKYDAVYAPIDLPFGTLGG